MPRHVLIAVAMAAALTTPLYAQSRTGRITGTVRDQQGAVIPDALVAIQCAEEHRDVTTTSEGAFSAAGLPLMPCSVRASSEAFEPEFTTVDARSGTAATLVLRVRTFTSQIVVTPTRGGEERTFDVPESVGVITRTDLDRRPFTLVPQALREEPGILLQQTTSAQTSPVIRGFTGQQNLYVLDGVRLNNASWRSGPSQYLAWVDGGPVDSIEVVRGGGSVQYGSDALGGTIQFRTTPVLSAMHTPMSGSLEFTAASADRMVGGQADVAFRFRSANLRIGGSRRSVGDLRAGEGLDSHSAVTRFLGLSSSILGERHRATSFDQGGAYGVADVGLATRGTLRAFFMHESQDDASRYDRLLGGEGLFASGFEPQTLDFGLVRYQVAPKRFFLNGVSATFSINRQADGRFEQARPVARLDRQEATTMAYGYQLQGTRDFPRSQQLLIGTELYDETIDATRELVEPSGLVQSARPDIPGGTTYSNLGLFAQHRITVLADRLSLRGGVRFSQFRFATTPDAALNVVDERETMRSTTFLTGAVLAVSEHVHITGNVNRSIRAANAADLGSIGLTGGGGFEITPSRAAELGAFVGTTAATGAVSTGDRVPRLKPEVVYQYELGVKARARRLSISVNGFDLESFDFIQRRALVFDASIVGTNISGFQVTSVDATGLAYIAQDIRPISTRVNIDRGRVRGFDAEGELRLLRNWTARAYFSMANGKALPSGEFSRRMPPPMGGARLRWANGGTWAEGVVTFAADQTRLNSADLTDARIGATRTRSSIATFFNGTATDLGLVQGGILLATGETLSQVQNRVLGSPSVNSAPMFTSQPGFVTVGLRGGVRLARHLDVTLIGENLTDVNYRLHGSGVDAPGRNLQVRTRLQF